MLFEAQREGDMGTLRQPLVRVFERAVWKALLSRGLNEIPLRCFRIERGMSLVGANGIPPLLGKCAVYAFAAPGRREQKLPSEFGWHRGLDMIRPKLNAWGVLFEKKIKYKTGGRLYEQLCKPFDEIHLRDPSGEN